MTRALQQKIHVGCRQLGLDGDARRALQLVETGKASMKDMDGADLLKVIKRLKKDGFKTSSKGITKKHKAATRPDLRLIHVLWTKLGETGALRDPSRAGLNKFIRARFGNTWSSVPADVDMLRQWPQIDAVIQALKCWGDRAGIDFDWSEHRS
ncbi:gp16 family protein [Parasedimentitalea psychrophila]|uniref:Regulatory protein GemA n=1 Tax=Parasedimentitalea psychrophila TaxID=2997337 RepID=A0A9Y2L1B0_9RHOB|nr:regulatory protein GemA [Parasedimentitalea psychrophila]WIY25039.1 regulatory protein GemA [Parasedimentitalea psychrophila]